MKKDYGKFKKYLKDEFNYVPDGIYFDLFDIEPSSYYFEFASSTNILIIEEDKVELTEYDNPLNVIHFSSNGTSTDEYFNLYLIDELAILSKVENVQKLRNHMKEQLLADLIKW